MRSNVPKTCSYIHTCTYIYIYIDVCTSNIPQHDICEYLGSCTRSDIQGPWHELQTAKACEIEHSRTHVDSDEFEMGRRSCSNSNVVYPMRMLVWGGGGTYIRTYTCAIPPRFTKLIGTWGANQQPWVALGSCNPESHTS